MNFLSVWHAQLLTLLNSADSISGTIPQAPGCILQPKGYAIKSQHDCFGIDNIVLVP